VTLTLRRVPSTIAITVIAALLAALVFVSGWGVRSAQPDATVVRQAAAAAPTVAAVLPAGVPTRQLVDDYTAALRAQPNNPQAYTNLALAELQQVREDGDPTWYTKADALLTKALALDPKNFAALGGLGSLAASRHDFAGALALGRRALAIDPSSSYALGVMVDAEVELGRYGDARRTLERMLNTRPDLSSYSRASYFLELHGDIAGARRALQQAIASGAPARENTAWAYLYLGNLEFGQGHYGAAQRQYRLAAQAQPGFVHAIAAEAKLDAARGRYARAIALYTTATQRLPLPSYVIALGDVQAAAGRRAAAARTYGLVRAEEALYQANGVNVDVELALFETDHRGDPQQALGYARAAAAVQHSVVVEDALGWTLYRAGHPHQALAAANRALALGTRDAGFLFHRGAIEAGLGMRTAAARDLSRALAINPHFSVLYELRARRLLKQVSG
jgi:tetratricopeptide (TPR) repeat protein